MHDKPMALVVDDDLLVCKVVQKMLGKQGVECVRAVNGKEAIALLTTEQNHFSIVLLDLVLPGSITGWDILEVLQRKEDLLDIPVVVMTGASISEDEIKKLKMRAYTVLRKPDFAIESFDNLLGEILALEAK